MHVRQVRIRGFKRFASCDVPLNEHMTILVGDNESGKSTVLEAIGLALTGRYHNQHISQALTQDLFNAESLQAYLRGMASGSYDEPPSILIEVEFGGSEAELARYRGDKNTLHDSKASGIQFHIEPDWESYSDEYHRIVASRGMRVLPVELYHFWWESFARERLRPGMIPHTAILVDSFSLSNSAASRSFVSMLVRDGLPKDSQISASLAMRNALKSFEEDESVKSINGTLAERESLTGKRVSISARQTARSTWESEIEARLDSVSFDNVGLGRQSVAKVELALASADPDRAGTILIEEPESHLSHANLSSLLASIGASRESAQLVVTTHSSFVANKLQLSNLALIGGDGVSSLSRLSPSTATFFQKAAGYNTLRALLCRAAILVEGDSDELVVQRSFMDRHGGRLPIQEGIEVISVGTSFQRFIELCEPTGTVLAVITDNDGHPDALEERYANYLNPTVGNVFVSFDREVLEHGDIEGYSYNTLEPEILQANSLDAINAVLGKEFANRDEALGYMRGHKTDCALKIFSWHEPITYPDYILAAIAFIERRLGIDPIAQDG